MGLKTCRRCGGIHRKGESCTMKKQRPEPLTDERKIRSSHAWTVKAKAIKRRDNYICQACLHEVEGTIQKYNSKSLEVHHITKLSEDSSLAYEENNLITLCKFHHVMADNGGIPEDVLRFWVPPGGRK